MNTLLHKLCEKSEEELWEMLKNKEWTPECAQITYYLVEIMKAVKKMEYLEKVEESMDWGIEEMKKQNKEEEEGKEKSEYARGRRGRNNYEWDDEMSMYARSRSGRSRIGRYSNYEYDNYDQYGEGNYSNGQGQDQGRSGGSTNNMTSYNYFPMTPEQIMMNPEMKEKMKKMMEEEEKKEKEKEATGRPGTK